MNVNNILVIYLDGFREGQMFFVDFHRPQPSIKNATESEETRKWSST